jgi:hypothetical protein
MFRRRSIALYRLLPTIQNRIALQFRRLLLYFMALCLYGKFLTFISTKLRLIVVGSNVLMIINLVCLICLFFGIILRLR